jgi:YD repeat-containing protein
VLSIAQPVIAATPDKAQGQQVADAFTETFSYTGPGEVTAKQWGVVRDFPYTNPQGVLTHTTAGFTLSQSYTWDGEGRMSTSSYPSVTVCGYTTSCQAGSTVAGPAFSYGYL